MVPSNIKNEVNMTSHKYTNKLIDESSPYLLQHAHNPVNWYPWGEDALEKAKKENKPIIVSVGYAACHWCHVMEHESFEDIDAAEFMNENYICIKVDREERPDIDQVYINAVQLISGSGGWPLNCIALPDGRPVYGGTYFPKENWIGMLSQVLNFIRETPDKAEKQAKALTEGVQTSEEIYQGGMEGEKYSIDDLHTIFEKWKNNIDYIDGGHKGAPKFPLPVGFRYLLRYYEQSGNSEAIDAVNISLTKMAQGGIYDQIGGGFARYSTDSKWIAPHFEKMLYDNAQLVSLYSEAYQLTKNPLYKEVVSETLEYIDREKTSSEGGFYSSLDADSEGAEGTFYIWEKKELEEILTGKIGKEKTELILDYYSVVEGGNWEGKNILYRSLDDKQIIDKYKISIDGIDKDELDKIVREVKEILLKIRDKRVRPGLDDKILTGWNGLMLKALVDAYRAFDDNRYLGAALKNAEFITSNLKSSDHRLNRNYKNGKASINGFLDDYAFTIEGFIALYQATFDERWLKEALSLTEYAVEHFYDEQKDMFFYTSDIDPKLIARKKEISDNVIPASNSQMAINLYLLGEYFYRDDLIKKSKKMLALIKGMALQSGTYCANWDILMTYFINGVSEVAILGDDAKKMRREFDKKFLPNTFFSGGESEGELPLLNDKLIDEQTTIYICKNKVCKLPVTEVAEALKQI
jgi:uncharacterized protein YyaL (SSP411 family)